MRNNGFKQYRFKDNPMEKRFAKMWEEENTPVNSDNLLEYLLSDNMPTSVGEVTKRDRKVAATVIQWLGSPVGRGFLSDVLGRNVRGY